MGHSTDKIELIVLGGTWSSYPRDYQEWFITRCFDAMNAEESPTLERAQQINENARHRNVGLAIETRPDAIDEEEIVHLRRLGVTKVQIGVQSLNQEILDLNGRGCTVSQIGAAFDLLRAGGFKIHAHWMPNLLGATPESDLEDFAHLWDDPAFRPDELKIYPCSLIPGTELHRLWLKGQYQPYPDDTLIDLIVKCKLMVPPYCRITRVMRDIPSGNIAAGCKKANLRQLVQLAMRAQGRKCNCIRCREVGEYRIDEATLTLREISYDTETTVEHFLSFVRADAHEDPASPRLAAFLRLWLPRMGGMIDRCFIDEIRNSAMIREVHVYGPAVGIGSDGAGHPQHRGLGTRLLRRASELAADAGFKRIAVISAIGTRQYYRSRGFEQGELYMHRNLDRPGVLPPQK